MTYTYFTENYPTKISQVEIHPPKTDYLKLPSSSGLTSQEQEIIDHIEKLFKGSIEGSNQSTLLRLQLSADLFEFAEAQTLRLIERANQWRATIKYSRKDQYEFMIYYSSMRGSEELILGRITFIHL